MIGLVVSLACGWVGLSASSASASARLRSGVLHAQLASHLSGTSTASSDTVLTSSDIMAAIVGLLAVLALLFMIVTIIRRQPASD